MDKFTKEQTSLFTVIAAVFMLLAIFVFNLIPNGWATVTPWKLLTEGGSEIGFFGYVFIILFILIPIYLCLYAYRDAKALEPLKPILNISPKVVYSVPMVLIFLLIIYGLMKIGIAALWVYLLATVAVFFIGQKSA